jgi:hypothetical protein
MDERMIVAYLALKGISARAIHRDLVVALGCNTVTCRSVTRFLHEASCLRFHEDTQSLEIERVINLSCSLSMKIYLHPCGSSRG